MEFSYCKHMGSRDKKDTYTLRQSWSDCLLPGPCLRPSSARSYCSKGDDCLQAFLFLQVREVGKENLMQRKLVRGMKVVVQTMTEPFSDVGQ